MGFTGACGSPVQVVDWFMWFTVSCGSLVHWFTGSPVHVVHWFMWFSGSGS